MNKKILIISLMCLFLLQITLATNNLTSDRILLLGDYTENITITGDIIFGNITSNRTTMHDSFIQGSRLQLDCQVAIDNPHLSRKEDKIYYKACKKTYPNLEPSLYRCKYEKGDVVNHKTQGTMIIESWYYDHNYDKCLYKTTRIIIDEFVAREENDLEKIGHVNTKKNFFVNNKWQIREKTFFQKYKEILYGILFVIFVWIVWIIFIIITKGLNKIKGE